MHLKCRYKNEYIRMKIYTHIQIRIWMNVQSCINIYIYIDGPREFTSLKNRNDRGQSYTQR